MNGYPTPDHFQSVNAPMLKDKWKLAEEELVKTYRTTELFKIDEWVDSLNENQRGILIKYLKKEDEKRMESRHLYNT